MSLFGMPVVASMTARLMQASVRVGMRVPSSRSGTLAARPRTHRADPGGPGAGNGIYLPAGVDQLPVYVNFHGGGFVMPLVELDDPLCRYLATETGVAVVNVDYLIAPQSAM
jgi:acetyl esterase